MKAGYRAALTPGTAITSLLSLLSSFIWVQFTTPLHLMHSLTYAGTECMQIRLKRSPADLSCLLLSPPPPCQLLPSQFYLSIDLFLSHSLTRLLPFIISQIKSGSLSIPATAASLRSFPPLGPYVLCARTPRLFPAPSSSCVELKQGQRLNHILSSLNKKAIILKYASSHESTVTYP